LSGDFGISFLEDSKKKLIHFIYRSNPYQGASMLLQCNAVNVLMPVPDRVSYHDAWFMFCACAKNSFVYVDKVITKYRQHRNNASGSQIRGKWSYYITAIKRTLKSTFFDKRDLSDRYYHCNALVERFSIEDKETKDIVVNARDFFAHRFNLIYRIKMLPFWIKNYRYISLSDSKKIFIMRLLKFLFFR
jgi:hypothetical protein